MNNKILNLTLVILSIFVCFIFITNFISAQDVNNDINNNSDNSNNNNSDFQIEDVNLDSVEDINLGADYDIDFILSAPKEAKKLFNKNIDAVPDFIKKTFGNERILLNIVDENTDGNSLSIVMKDGLVELIDTNKLDKYTLQIQITKEKANRLISGKSPIDTFKEAIDNKELVYKGVGFFSSIKYFFVNLFANFI